MPRLAETSSEAPKSHRLPLGPPAATSHTHLSSPPSASCHSLPSSCLQLDILLWSVIVPALTLVMFTRTFHRNPAGATQPQPSYLIVSNDPIAQLLLPRCVTMLMLSSACSAATLLAPSWYLERGRSQLLAAVRLLPNAVTLAQLLLPPMHALRELQQAWVHTGMFGGKGVLAVIVWPVMFPVPVQTYLKLAPLECGLALAADSMLTYRTSRPDDSSTPLRIAVLALYYAVCGLALPVAVLTYATLPRFRQAWLTPQDRTASGDARLGSATSVSTTAACPPSAPEERPASSTPGTTAPPRSLSLAAPLQAPEKEGKATEERSHGPAATSAKLAPPAAAAATTTITATSGAPRSRCKSSLYRSRTATRMLSIKVHNHAAFKNRQAILASLAPYLQGTSQPHCPHPTRVLITSCAVEGCLQLLITASTLDGCDAFLLPPGDDLSQFFCQLHAQLPASCVHDLVTIHLDDTLAVFKGSTGQQLPPELLHLPRSEGNDGSQWAPICWEAGSQELELHLGDGTMEWVEAVVQCRTQGKEVSVNLPLQRVAGSAGRSRLHLPAALDPGPVAIHLLSTQEGRQGVLLGSATTMALPPPAAAELLQAHIVDFAGSTASQPAFQAGMRDLVRDYALCWQMHSGRQHATTYPENLAMPHQATSIGIAGDGPSGPLMGPALSNLLRYLSGSDMQACHDLLLAYTTSSPTTPTPTGIPPPKPAAAAAASTSSVGPIAETAAANQRQVALGGSQQRAPATLLQRLAARMSRTAAMSRSPRYAAWRLQQRRWVDVNGWVFAVTMYAVGSAVIGKRRLDDVELHMHRLQAMATGLLHAATGVGTHLLLATVVGLRLRARREVVVALFAVTRLLLCLAAVLRWLPTPATVRVLWSTPRAVVVIHGVCRPCLIQVPWRLQLLVSAVEEASKYAALTLVPCYGLCGVTGALLPNWQYAWNGLTVVAVAVAVCWLVEALYLSAYTSFIEAQASMRKQEACNNTSCSKAEVDQ